jgi:hypothetical protein
MSLLDSNPFYLTLNRVKSRDFVWRNFSRAQTRTATCGLKALGSNVTLTRNLTKKGNLCAGVIGVETCGSMWSCPVCSAKISYQRRNEVIRALQAWKAMSPTHQVVFMTMTFRHNSTQSLQFLWDTLADAWRRMLQGRAWLRIRSRYGIRSFIRALEITHGANGWHVHLHVAMFLDTSVSVDSLQDEIYARWSYILADYGMTALPGIGVDVRRTYDDSGLGQYLTKLAQELTSSPLKDGRASRTPFAILNDLATKKTTDYDTDINLWVEYMTVSKGRQFIAWGKGLRAYLGVDEITDEEASLLAPDVIELESLQVSSRIWTKICIYGQLHQLLETMANHGSLSARLWIENTFNHWAERHGVTENG